MKTLIISDFNKEKECFKSMISLWEKEKVRLWVDIPEVEHSALEQCIDTVNQKVSWLEENKSVIVEAILDNFFSTLHKGSSETVTREDFAKTLEPVDLDISFKWNKTMIYVGCNQDYFSGHCFSVYINDKNEITSCGLEG